MNEFKIRTIYPWSKDPVYEVLVTERAGKGWFPLSIDGQPARFNRPPSSIEEAMDVIRAHKDEMDGADGAS